MNQHDPSAERAPRSRPSPCLPTTPASRYSPISAPFIQAGYGRALAAVNKEIVDSYWRSGERIVQEEQRGGHRAAYGKQLLNRLGRVESTQKSGVWPSAAGRHRDAAHRSQQARTRPNAQRGD